MDILKNLSDVKHVQRFQQFCGLEFKNSNNLCQNGLGNTHTTAINSERNGYEKVKHLRNGFKNGVVANGYQNGKVTKDINANSTSELKNDSHNYNHNDTKVGQQNGFSPVANGYHDHKEYLIHNNNNNIVKNGTTSAGGVNKVKSKKDFRINNLVPYYLAQVGAFLGDEMFYLTFYPFVIWNMDAVLGRQTIWVWTLVMFIGQATKDYLKVPRPRSPPVIHLETHHLNEFSLPSTHAMAGTAMPIVMTYLLLSRYQFPVWLALGCVPVWMTLTCLSRLYLGVHTILDVVCGVFYAVVIVLVTLPYISQVDKLIQTHPLSPIIMCTISIAMCTVCYPAQGKDVAKGSGVRIVAIYMGFSVSMWLNYQCGFTTIPTQTSLPYQITFPTLQWVLLSTVRFVIGAFSIMITKIILTKLSVRYFSYLAGLEKPDKLHPSVESGYIITTYSTIGIVLVFVVGIIHKYLGISRPSAYDFY